MAGTSTGTTTRGAGSWCEKCHRMIGVGCACELSFFEKVSSVTIDKAKMETTELHNYYDQEAVTDMFGHDAKDRYLDETDGLGAAKPGRDGAFWHTNRKTKEPERLTARQLDTYLGADTEL